MALSRRGVVAGAVLGLLALILAAWAVTRRLEERIATRVRQAGAAAGLGVGAVRFSWVGPLRLEGVTVERKGASSARVDRVDVLWSLAGGSDPRAHVRGLDLRGLHVAQGTLSADLTAARFDVVAFRPRGG